MTNVALLMNQAGEALQSAQNDHYKTHDNLAKRNLEQAISLLINAIGIIEDEYIIEVCQYCGDESETGDHLLAHCIKG